MKKGMLLSLLSALCLVMMAQDSTAIRNSELIYGRKDGMALTMFINRPAKNNLKRAVIQVVSGSWYSELGALKFYTKESNALVERGYTVFLVLHGSQPQYALPSMVSDLKRAVRYIRYNAKQLDIDPDKIGITGSSSGGHLALLVTLMDDKANPNAKDPIDRISSRVQAAGIFFPPVDFLNWSQDKFNIATEDELLKDFEVAAALDFKKWNDSLGKFTSLSGEAKTKMAGEMSPAYAVSADDPPVYLVHGDADEVVPLQQSKILADRLAAVKVPHELFIKKGGKHGWEDMSAESNKMADWFDQYLK